MDIYQGNEGFGRVALGTIKVIRKAGGLIVTGEAKGSGALSDYEKAKKRALAELKKQHKSSQVMLLSDHQLEDAIIGRILNQGCSAADAITGAGKHMEHMLSGHDDAYLVSKAADIKAISKLLLLCLDGYVDVADTMPDDCIIAADTLTTSDLLKLDKAKLRGLIVERSTVNSHMSIMAKAMGVPTIIGCEISDDWDGRRACVDGGWRALYIEPDERTVRDMEERIEEENKKDERLKALKGRKGVTKDGRSIRLYANIASLQELDAVIENDAEGIGLYRTEPAFVNRELPPAEEELFLEYRSLAAAMGSREVAIRTVDLAPGRDAPYLPFYGSAHSPGGLRGIRLSLKFHELFKTQIRAILRAAVYGNMFIILPMVSDTDEFLEARGIIETCCAELDAADIPYKHVPTGPMVETPAAVMMIDELAKEADFISIGSNDLTQYTLGVDRENRDLQEYCNYRHPSIMRLIRMTVEGCKKAGKPVGICGELAADEKLLPFFLEIGIDIISTIPGKILPMRSSITKL